MRPVALFCSLIVLAACAPKRTATSDRSAMAGTWTLAVSPAGSDRVSSTAILMATSDTAGWSVTLPNRAPLPLQVTMTGDSVLVVTSRYDHAPRNGVSALDSTVYRLVGDSLVGTTVTHFTGTGLDSVSRSRSAGVRIRD